MDNWKFPYQKPEWIGTEWNDLIFERHVFWNPATEQWAVRPSDGEVVAEFGERQAAIDYAYQLATSDEDDWCDIVVYDKNGEHDHTIDPEENLELSDKTKDLLRRHMDGKLEFIEYHPAKDVTDDVETHTIHHRDTPPSS
jgi:hypothetical protein